jgi:transmembrane sensor
LAVVVLAMVHARTPTPGAMTVEPSSPRPLVLNDGSEILPADSSTTIQVAEQTPESTTVALRSGSARFRIRHDRRRAFTVDAGTIVVEDLGTIFAVDRKKDGSVRVAVSEGRVAVVYPPSGERFELGAGDERVFFPVPEPRKPVPPSNDLPKPPAAEAAATHASSRAHSGDEAASLLSSADVARRSGNPQAAVAPLRRLVERFPRDPRAASAAFTLGWILLTDLGRPQDAAVAFAQAERVAPRGALAEDSAARVAEAWQKAGDLRRAAQAARHYQAAYPNGRYVSLMRGLVGEN